MTTTLPPLNMHGPDDDGRTHPDCAECQAHVRQLIRRADSSELMPTCGFNHPGSVTQVEGHMRCGQPARLLLVGRPADWGGGPVTEPVCRANPDHYRLAHAWLSALGTVTEFLLVDVTGHYQP